MAKFPAKEKSSNNSSLAGFLNAKLTKMQFALSTSIRLPDGSYEKQEDTVIKPPRKLRLLLGAAKFGPYLVSEGVKPDYSLMVDFKEACENGWDDPPEGYKEGIRIEVEIAGIGRTVWTSSQTTVRNMIWRMCEDWHDQPHSIAWNVLSSPSGSLAPTRSTAARTANWCSSPT